MFILGAYHAIGHSGECKVGRYRNAKIELLDNNGTSSRQVLIHIGRPSQEPSGEWSLPYQIVGLFNDRVFRVLGFDAVQALQGVQLVIGSSLAGLDEAKDGRLRWEGDTDLGFPIIPDGPKSS